MRTGDFKITGRSDLESGYLRCDGAAVSRLDYVDLFAAIGETFGAGDGSTTFNVPDFRARGPIGVTPPPGVNLGFTSTQQYAGGIEVETAQVSVNGEQSIEVQAGTGATAAALSHIHGSVVSIHPPCVGVNFIIKT